jgi:hypothetical protein
MYTNRSAGVLHVSGSATSAAGFLYNGADVGKGQSFALVGGNIGRFQTTVQATSADGRAVTLTAFIDAHSPSGCRASAQAVVSGP